MLIRTRKRWQIAESLATPESVYVNRRQLMAGGAALAGMSILAACDRAAPPAIAADDEGRMVLNAERNPKYVLDRDITPEELNLNYNNFYEYGSHKAVASAAQQLVPRPWTVSIEGMCDNPGTHDVDALINRMGLEERLYRHRCVEAWSMTVPWIGFELSKLVDFAQPRNEAKYVRFETFGDADMASGIRTQPWYPWPYIEGLTIEEARNELAFMVVGAYGKVLANQMGAPLRVHLPWKYGFKSGKSIVKLAFTDERPVSFWETLQANEYGFWANVNPNVPHPRWSQASERVIHTDERVPTQLFNGYAEEVAYLYADLGAVGDLLYR